VRTVLLALVLALLAAAPAGAAVTTIDAGLPAGSFRGTGFSGPVLAGGKVLWAVRGLDGAAALRVADTEGNREELLTRPADRSQGGFATVSASDTRVVFQREGHRCPDPGPCKNANVITNEVWGGALGGPLALLSACPPGGCTTTVGESSCPVDFYAVGGQWAATSDPCYERSLVLDPATPSARPRIFSGRSARTAGRFLVTVEGGVPAHAVVRDLANGDAEVYRVELPGPGDSLAYVYWFAFVQADGKILVASSRTPGVYWASPSEPTVHRVPLSEPAAGAAAAPVAFAGDRVYLQTTVTGPGNIALERRLVATDLAGDVVMNERAGPGIGEVAWDASRIAWAVQPCQAVQIVVKPFGERAADPFTDHSACPVPRVSRATLRLDRHGRVSVKLGCPASPPLGCRGTARAKVERPPGAEVVSGSFSIPPGGVAALRLRIPAFDRAAIADARDGRLRLELTVAPRETVPAATKSRVRVAHLALSPPRR
jgi:hypothetical protein